MLLLSQRNGVEARHRQGRSVCSGQAAADEYSGKGRKEVEQIATVASNYDAEIGKIIADAMDKVGKDGVITVEEGKSLQTEAKWIEGLQFDKGYLSPYFVTNPNTMQCVLEDPYLLIHEKKITTTKMLVPILEKISQTGKPLLIIAEEIEGEALTLLVVNKLRGSLKCAAVKARVLVINARRCWKTSLSLPAARLFLKIWVLTLKR